MERDFWSVWFESSLFNIAFTSLFGRRESLCQPSYNFLSIKNKFLKQVYIYIFYVINLIDGHLVLQFSCLVAAPAMESHEGGNSLRLAAIFFHVYS